MDFDPQQKPLYDWEDTWWGWNKSLITSKRSAQIIRRACRLWSVEPPRITTHEGRGLSFFQPSKNVISMQRHGGLNIPISLHEAAHAIVHAKFNKGVQDHGLTFVGVYLSLLEKFKVAPPRALRSSLAAAGVKWRAVKRKAKNA